MRTKRARENARIVRWLTSQMHAPDWERDWPWSYRVDLHIHAGGRDDNNRLKRMSKRQSLLRHASAIEGNGGGE